MDHPVSSPQLWHADHWTTLPAINNSEFRQQDSRKERTAKWWVSQTWRGYYLQEKRVLSGIHLTCFLLFYQKICLKVCEVWCEGLFKQNYCPQLVSQGLPLCFLSRPVVWVHLLPQLILIINASSKKLFLVSREYYKCSTRHKYLPNNSHNF